MGGPRPLDGVRVLDFTHVLAGPFATRIMADMGADVVKVNSAARPSNTPQSAYYAMWNRNKRALAMDMSAEASRDICRRLCERADVVIDNFSVGVLEGWGVHYEAIRERNPGVIYLAMSGMGESGPWSDFVTYAPTVHALAGLTYLTGLPDHADIGIGVSYNDHLSGLHAAVAALAALERRRRTGRGQRIEMSQFEVGVNLTGVSLLDYFANGRAAAPSGNRLPYDEAAPHNCYPCTGEDRWVAIAVMNDDQWRRFRAVMGDPTWARDARYDTAGGRCSDIEVLDCRVAGWTRTRPAESVQELCQAAGVPAGVVQTGADLGERDPQLARSRFQVAIEEAHPALGQTYADRLPIHFERTPADVYERSRLLGEDNVAVLADWLGMPESRVRVAEDEGALR